MNAMWSLRLSQLCEHKYRRQLHFMILWWFFFLFFLCVCVCGDKLRMLLVCFRLTRKILVYILDWSTREVLVIRLNMQDFFFKLLCCWWWLVLCIFSRACLHVHFLCEYSLCSFVWPYIQYSLDTFWVCVYVCL